MVTIRVPSLHIFDQFVINENQHNNNMKQTSCIIFIKIHIPKWHFHHSAHSYYISQLTVPCVNVMCTSKCDEHYFSICRPGNLAHAQTRLALDTSRRRCCLHFLKAWSQNPAVNSAQNKPIAQKYIDTRFTS